MEKSPYQRFICANAKNIGPAPWAPFEEIQSEKKSYKEGRKEERKEGHGESEDIQEEIKDQGQEESEDQGQEESKDEITWKRRPVSINIHLLLPPSCSLTLFNQYWMLCLTVIVAFSLSLWKSRRFACGTGLAICFITRSVCNFDLFDFPLNLPMKALCSSAPPLHPQYIHGYCNSFTWPWFLHSPQRETGLSPLRNYASSGAGARITSELTSPTHGVPKSSFLGYFTDSLDRKIHIPPPFVILEDRISDGDCWRISGNTGQVGVRLSAPIIISHITFDYVSSTLLAPVAIAAAPRNMSLWVFVDDIPEFKSLAKDVRKITSEFVARGKFKKAGVFIRIADFQYNVSLAASQQRFPVQRHLSAPTQDVVLRVENNEGGDTTCIYWVGIHGRPG